MSKAISLLDQHGSQVLLGNILMVPIDQSMLYVRPLYTESRQPPAAAEGRHRRPRADSGDEVVARQGPELSAHTQLGTASTSQTPQSRTKAPVKTADVQQAQADLQQAAADYAQAQKDLRPGHSAATRARTRRAQKEESTAKSLLGSVPAAPTTTTTTPTDHDRPQVRSSRRASKRHSHQGLRVDGTGTEDDEHHKAPRRRDKEQGSGGH